MRDPVVFLPGMMCDTRLFGPQVTALGRSMAVMTAPIIHGERIEEIASVLLDVLPRRFAVAGHAMGGIVAMELLRRAPDRVSRIALLDTSPLAETPQSAADYEPPLIKLRAGRLPEAVAGFVPVESLALGTERARVHSLLTEMAESVGPDTITRQARALQRRRDYQAVLRRCKVPTLVLCGRHDTLFPLKRHSFLADLIPDADLAVIDDGGHLPTLEAPAETTRALSDWLAQPNSMPSRADA